MPKNKYKKQSYLSLFKSLLEQRKNVLIKFLDYICEKHNIKKISSDYIREIKLRSVLFKVDYRSIKEYKSKLGHRLSYNIENIIYDITGERIIKTMDYGYTAELNNEIEEYKAFVTDKMNIDIPRNTIQRENTFDSITLRGIRAFIDYLMYEKDIQLTKIKSLYEYILEYFLDFVRFLNKTSKTTGKTFKIRFIRSIFFYYRNKLDLCEKDLQQISRFREDFLKLSSRFEFKDSVRIKNKKRRRKKVSVIDIVSAIKRLEIDYEINKKYYTLKALVSLKLLLHLGWRGSNIVNLKLGDTLIFQDKKWHYIFRPEQQKAPMKEGHKELVIEGIFPSRLQKNISELINWNKTKDYLLKTQGNRPYNTSSFCGYMKKITKKHIGTELNPHVFRDIIFSYLIKKGYNYVNAELFLWHKPKAITSVDMSYLDIDINSAVKYVNKKLERLYREKQDNKKSDKSNVIYFPNIS